MAEKAIIIGVLIGLIGTWAIYSAFHSPRSLGDAELRLGYSIAIVPQQPVAVIQKCGEEQTTQRPPVVIEVDQIGDRFLPVDVLPCYTGNEYLYVVAARAAELRSVVRRPVISLRVDNHAHVHDLKLIRSSGSNSLDERALRTVLAHPHNKNYCTRCGVTTVVNIEWNGPIWFKE